MTSNRNSSAIGTALCCLTASLILAVGAQAQTLTLLPNFAGPNAHPPDAAFVQGANGDLYNVSSNGGKTLWGTASQRHFLSDNHDEVTPRVTRPP